MSSLSLVLLELVEVQDSPCEEVEPSNIAFHLFDSVASQLVTLRLGDL